MYQEKINPFENNDVLPKNMAPIARRALEKAGVKFNEDFEKNKLLYKVVLPKGWSITRCPKKELDFLLKDKKGFLRATILCTQHDYRLHLEGRFELVPDKLHYKNTGRLRVLVIEGHKDKLFSTPCISIENRTTYLREERNLLDKSEKWLSIRYPHWRRTNFYWDQK